MTSSIHASNKTENFYCIGKGDWKMEKQYMQSMTMLRLMDLK